MRRGWLVAYRRCGAIILEVFGQIGLEFGELQNFELIGVEEEHRCLDDGANQSLQDLMYHFQFYDVSREVWRVGRA